MSFPVLWCPILTDSQGCVATTGSDKLPTTHQLFSPALDGTLRVPKMAVAAVSQPAVRVKVCMRRRAKSDILFRPRAKVMRERARRKEGPFIKDIHTGRGRGRSPKSDLGKEAAWI